MPAPTSDNSFQHKVGDVLAWRIMAQGSRRMAKGKVIAITRSSGQSPKDIWPKELKKPTTVRQCHDFKKPRQAPFAIIEEVIGTKLYYRTPPLSTAFVQASKVDPPKTQKRKERIS